MTQSTSAEVLGELLLNSDPDYRTEKISSVADAEFYEELFQRGIDGAKDNWLLEKYSYSRNHDGRVSGTATFRKLIPIGGSQ